MGVQRRDDLSAFAHGGVSCRPLSVTDILPESTRIRPGATVPAVTMRSCVR